MKKNPLIVPGLLTALCLLHPADTRAQGALVPPGPPAPTMKTLEQLEPRTPISSLPATITQPGSYYLAGNLSSTTNGITVTVDGVTLDLAGFSITGPNGYTGISVDGADRVVIKGGTIHRFFIGINIADGELCRIENLVVSHCNNTGIALRGNNRGNTITHCTIGRNQVNGIWITGGEANAVSENMISDCRYGMTLNNTNANRIEGNHLFTTNTGITYGIATSLTARNFIVKNTCVGASTAYVVGINDTWGPVVSSSGALSSTGDPSHPWANFSR